jgi:tRNA-specific 2-thiouridylase
MVHDQSGGRARLFRGADSAKDQSYFLFALGQQQLSRTLFPLGQMNKDDVRDHARRISLPAAERPESQDICFGDYKALVASYANESELSGGDIVDRSGRVLGTHHGIHEVTVGQRHGLGISSSGPLYVVEIDAASKRVVMGKKVELSCVGLVARVNWICPSTAI